MLFNLVIKNGKVVKGALELSKYLKSLNGNYIVDINEEVGITTIKKCRDAYFFKVDLVCKATGSEKYDIHEDFKKAYEIPTTKNLTVVDWRNLIKKFQIYVFENLDIIV